MGAAFEVNRQMCDLDIPLRNPIKPIKPLPEEMSLELIGKLAKEWDSKKKEIVESIFKGNDMEKKKMTKAEAFEYLKGKKVSVSCREISEKVQSKLFDCGVIWKNGGTDFCDYGNYFVINSHGLLTHCDGMGSYWECLINEEISADDILSIEIVEEKYELEFNYDKAVELAKPLMHYLNDTGCSERICVTYESIVAEPMATFLHGQMKGC